jgi:Tfp pilus assembly protein PilF
MWFVLALLAQATDFQAEGIKALDARQYPAAVELFEKAVAQDPKDYAAHFHLALAYSMAGKDAEAIRAYKSTLELKPGLYEAELNLGICLVRAKDPGAAVPYLKSAATQKPAEVRPAFSLAQALLDSHQFPEAEAQFNAVLAMGTPTATAELGLAQSMARQGRVADADPHYRKAAALDPSYKDALLELAALYEEKHDASAAIAIYRQFPENPGAQERMGALLARSGDASRAIPALEAAVASSPTLANRIALAQAYMDSKQPDKAAPLIAQTVAAEPGNYDLQMFYARFLRDQRKFPDAAQQFLAASKLKPDAPTPWNELAGVLVVAGEYQQALVALDRVRALGAETPSHYYFRALSLDHLHQVKDALANYNKFLELSQGKFPDEEFKARQRARILQNELNKR